MNGAFLNTVLTYAGPVGGGEEQLLLTEKLRGVFRGVFRRAFFDSCTSVKTV
jgi:hypothetical protein